jgi:hypothetical protein
MRQREGRELSPSKENETTVQATTEPAPATRREGLVRELIGLLKRDWLVQSGLIVLGLTAAMVIFVSVSDLPLHRPLVGIVIYAFLPLLFIFGAVVFILTILRH